MFQAGRLIFSLVILILVLPCHAWNALGHRLIGQITYNQLSPAVQTKIDYYNHALDTVYHPQSFINAAPWMDTLRYVNDVWMKPLHYIDIPFTIDGTPLIPPEEPNAVLAIIAAQSVLTNPQTSDFDKGFAARVLLHVIGDIHQPLHASSQFSQRYPKGDKGGNLFYLGNNPVGNNLHAYWDKGGGFLISPHDLDDEALRLMAKTIEAKWPCDLDSVDYDPKTAPKAWSEESFQLAVNKAYALPDHQKPSQDYQTMTQELSQQRLALAGCRIAKVLNASLG